MKNCSPFTIVFLVSLISACAAVNPVTVTPVDEIRAGRTALLSGKPNEALAHFRRVTDRDPKYINTSTPFQEGVWTYIGRAYYELGKLVEANGALGFALAQNPDDFLAVLYLGLTRLRTAKVPENDNSFSHQDIEFALKERITPARLTTLVKERGVNFVMTQEMETAFRRLGADYELITQIKRSSNSMSPESKSRLQGLKEIETSVGAIEKWLAQMLATPQGRFWDPGRKIRFEIKKLLALIDDKTVNYGQLISGVEWLGKALEEEIDLAERDAREQKTLRGGI